MKPNILTQKYLEDFIYVTQNLTGRLSVQANQRVKIQRFNLI